MVHLDIARQIPRHGSVLIPLWKHLQNRLTPIVCRFDIIDCEHRRGNLKHRAGKSAEGRRKSHERTDRQIHAVLDHEIIQHNRKHRVHAPHQCIDSDGHLLLADVDSS